MKNLNSEFIISLKQEIANYMFLYKTFEEKQQLVKSKLEENGLDNIYEIFLKHSTEEEPVYVTIETVLFAEMYKNAIKNEYVMKEYERVMFLAFYLETIEIMINKLFNNDNNNDNDNDNILSSFKEELNKNILSILEIFDIRRDKIKSILDRINLNKKLENNIRFIIKEELL